MKSEASNETNDSLANQPNIIHMSDEDLFAVAHPMWDDLIKYSNKGQYGKFIRKFSYNLLLGLNEVEVGKQFAKSDLTRNLDPNYDFLVQFAVVNMSRCYIGFVAPKKKANG
jgi:hypothetical protein